MNSIVFFVQSWIDIFIRSEAVRTAAIIIATFLFLSLFLVFAIYQTINQNRQYDIIKLQMELVKEQQKQKNDSFQKTKFQKTKHISK